MSRLNIKQRIIQSIPALGDLLAKQSITAQQLVTGAVAGDVAVSGIKLGDNLISVINVTDLTDVTSEFAITADGIINNAGGTTTATDAVLVLYEKWMLRE